jgi:hypothetical protein
MSDETLHKIVATTTIPENGANLIINSGRFGADLALQITGGGPCIGRDCTPTSGPFKE